MHKELRAVLLRRKKITVPDIAMDFQTAYTQVLSNERGSSIKSKNEKHLLVPVTLILLAGTTYITLIQGSKQFARTTDPPFLPAGGR